MPSSPSPLLPPTKNKMLHGHKTWLLQPYIQIHINYVVTHIHTCSLLTKASYVCWYMSSSRPKEIMFKKCFLFQIFPKITSLCLLLFFFAPHCCHYIFLAIQILIKFTSYNKSQCYSYASMHVQ